MYMGLARSGVGVSNNELYKMGCRHNSMCVALHCTSTAAAAVAATCMHLMSALCDIGGAVVRWYGMACAIMIQLKVYMCLCIRG